MTAPCCLVGLSFLKPHIHESKGIRRNEANMCLREGGGCLCLGMEVLWVELVAECACALTCLVRCLVQACRPFDTRRGRHVCWTPCLLSPVCLPPPLSALQLPTWGLQTPPTAASHLHRDRCVV